MGNYTDIEKEFEAICIVGGTVMHEQGSCRSTIAVNYMKLCHKKIMQKSIKMMPDIESDITK